MPRKSAPGIINNYLLVGIFGSLGILGTGVWINLQKTHNIEVNLEKRITILEVNFEKRITILETIYGFNGPASAKNHQVDENDLAKIE